MRDIQQLTAQIYEDRARHGLHEDVAPFEMTEEEFLHLVSECIFYGRKVTIKKEAV